ncbi:hypothetical protein V6N11_057438 [Hibiscus sabdariffa]|uniref:Uncharacterized protein n=2 Tax=Hibiscus sabdariffa TaxID=183260 RepID=A0ABR1ZT98_9ROSI
MGFLWLWVDGLCFLLGGLSRAAFGLETVVVNERVKGAVALRDDDEWSGLRWVKACSMEMEEGVTGDAEGWFINGDEELMVVVDVMEVSGGTA